MILSVTLVIRHEDAIAFVLGNFILTFFVLGLLAAAIALWCGRTERGRAAIVDALFSYFLLIPLVGLLFLWLQRRA